MQHLLMLIGSYTHCLYIISASYIANKNKVNHSAKIYVGENNFAIYKVSYDYNWIDYHFRKSSIDSLFEADTRWTGEFYYDEYNDKLLLRNFTFHHTTGIHDRMFKRKICDIEVYKEYITQDITFGDRKDLHKEAYSDKNIELTKPVETVLYKSIIKDLDSLSSIP